MTTAKSLRLLLGLSLAALFLWLIFRQVRLPEIKRAFETADFRWITAALLAFGLGYCCRIERWRVMLKCDNPRIDWRTCAGPFMASFAANNVLPFRAGDVLRSFAFNGLLGTSSGVVIATLLAERLLDLLMVLALLAVALMVFDMRNSGIVVGVGSAVPVAGAAAILVVLFRPGLLRPLALAGGQFASRISPKLSQIILDEIEKSLVAIRHLTRGHTMIRLVFWSVLAWLAEGCVFWFSALALPSITAPLASWAALPAGTLATLIPSTPGYVGTFDYFTVHAMTLLGNSAVATTAYALLVHALLWLPPTLIGGLYLLLRR